MAGEGRVAAKAVQIEIAQAIERAVKDSLMGANRQMVAFLRGMEVGAKGDMQRVNREIAAAMRTAVSDEYNRTVESVRRVPSYTRPGRLSGHLGKVIRRPDLVRADGDGIYYLNEAAMDKEAAHWRRLNFGAGAAAGPQSAPVPLRLFGETVASARLPYSASPAFSLPKGFFIEGGRAMIPDASYRGGGTRGTFAPSRRSPYRPAVTAGIRGRHFLEAGLEVLGEQLPVKYADLLNEWIQQGGRKARAITGNG